MLAFVGTAAPVAADDTLCKPSLALRADGAQVADDNFKPQIRNPVFAVGRGPKLLLDEAHANFHTVDGRYRPFVELLRADGFVVEASRQTITTAALQDSRILVIANATAPRKDGDAFIPAASAFATAEINALRQWVAAGGSLLLIADHLPWGGDAAVLAEAFGLLFSNGYATDEACGADEFLFQRSDDSLRDHPITRGRNAAERITAVRTITGQAFRATDPKALSPLLVLAPNTVLLLPTAPWQFTAQTPRVAAQGMLQGAVLTVGKGRVAAFGEAAMFSAQVSGPQRRPMGMNMETAAENPQFLLNVMHWLAGLLPER
jgi:hypothetical protein